MPLALPRGSIIALCLPLLACSAKPQPAPPAPPPAAAPPAAPAPAVPTPPAAAEPIPEAEVKAALDAWLAAQNQGDFERYAQLYAAKLYGVKRAGERVTRFDRAGWLADRKRMFQKPMQVEAREPQIRSSSGGAQVELTQHWASGKFEDLGQKRLLFVREGGPLKIAQEEMLSSQLLATAADAAPWAKGFHFVITLASGAYLALPEEEPPAMEGAPRREQDPADQNLYVTSRATRAGALPAWKGARLRLDTGCEATLGEVRVLSRVVPHFGIVETWLKGSEDPPQPPLTAAQLAQQAFVSGTPLTAARLEGCAQGKYAVLASATPPLAAETPTDPALSARARSAFAALPTVKEQQRTFLKEVAGAKGPWWEPGLRIVIGRHPQSGQTLVSAQAQNGGPCEELGSGTWALFEVSGAQLRLVRESDAGSAVEQLLDVNGDGKLEVLTHGELGTERELIVPQQETPAAQLVYDYQDCPC